MIEILEGDNLAILEGFEDRSFDLIYIDPPFNTGKRQEIHGNSYGDSYNDFMGFIRPGLKEAYRLLKLTGSLFVHLDYREIHYVKVALDQIFGREHFRNEIIWAYDYGARSKSKWPAKHDTILWYTKTSKYTFNYDAMDRIPYMAPSLAGKDKALRGKTPTDVWWHTIVPTNGAERLGYPTQKPEGVLRRIVNVHSNSGDRLLDFFAGSGTLGAVASDRDCVLIDQNPEAIAIMRKRLL